MNQIVNMDAHDERMEQIASALTNGLIVVDSAGRIVWMDNATREIINGGLQHLSLPLARTDMAGVDCFFSTVDVASNGVRRTLCVLQQTAAQGDVGRDLVDAIEAVMSETSRTIVEKLKAWRQAKRSAANASDLDLLSDREREILALICEGRSDTDMSRLLNLSQNTVRNHVASLYRKIGVNRRSAAIIWTRERAITSYEFMVAKRRGRASHRNGR
jgi:DNA-binding CsgD family transcriptional regulator